MAARRSARLKCKLGETSKITLSPIKRKNKKDEIKKAGNGSNLKLSHCGHKNTSQNEEKSNEMLKKDDCKETLPKSIAEYKRSSLYVLERYLLKHEALYPPDVKPVGYIKGEAVYPRSAVRNVYSRRIQLLVGRAVRPGEKPYKIHKMKKKKYRTEELEREDCELFGGWQTDPVTK